MIAKAQIIGWVASEPQSTGKSVAITNFSVGFYTGKKALDGKSESAFMSCSVFGKSAENALDLLHKGDLVFVEGSLNSYVSKGKDRVERTQIALNAGSFRLLKQKGGDYAQNPQVTARSRDVNPNDFEGLDNSELPF